MPYTGWHWLFNEVIKYLALMMDLKDAILMNTPQQLLAEENGKEKRVPLTRALLSVLLHGAKRLLQIKIKVVFARPAAA